MKHRMMKLTAKNTNFNIFRSSHHLSYVIIIIIIYLFICFNFLSLSLKSSFYASLTVLFLFDWDETFTMSINCNLYFWQVNLYEQSYCTIAWL